MDIAADEMERLVELSEGNPGAATVLGNIHGNPTVDTDRAMSALEGLNLGGPRIWIGYKDYCEQDLEQFVECVLEHDEAMIELINDRSGPDAPTVG